MDNFSTGDTDLSSDQVVHFLCKANETFPNNDKLELLILKQVFFPAETGLAGLIEQHFTENGWPAAWRNGLYDVHHYHSTAHEVLGVYSGWVKACFGGPGGVIQTADVGDVIIIPAGVSHKNIEQSANFRVVGAYPRGQQWNMKYGREGERPRVDEQIRQVALPHTDPVFGKNGPLSIIWDVE